MKILHEKDIRPDQLRKHIQEMLQVSKIPGSVQIDLEGATNTARCLDAQLGRKFT